MISLTKLTSRKEIHDKLIKDDLWIEILGSTNVESGLKFIDDYRFYSIHEDETEVGIFAISHKDTYSIFHGGIYKEHRNKKTKEYLLHCLNKIGNKKPLITTTKTDNILAQKLVESIGFKQNLILNNEYILYTEY